MTPASSTASRRPRGANGTAAPATRRVAIYARQSVDRGDEFGSTDAQHEAVAAFVASQRGAGWVTVDERYHDRGESGATLDRPAFRRLLADVEAGRIDVVAVYKIDRLSRSLLDFTQLMRRFEERGVEFVSVTQQFSTSTSVGRMTLHLLATFAQFERETISERTRDKIAATRRRGRWTGGHPVLGYDARDGRLEVNVEEAERVRAIFRLYLERDSLLRVVEELRARGWATKSWVNRSGALVPGRAFDKSGLRRHLSNPLYAGRMTLRAETFAGEHEAIVDQETWDAVQARLRERRRERSSPTVDRPRWDVLLAGLVRCARCDSAMSHHFAVKGGRRYGAYVCSRYVKQGAASCPDSRVAVGELEGFVLDRLRAIGRDPALLDATIAAARQRLAGRAPEIDEALAEVGRDRDRASNERQRLVAAIGAGTGSSPALVERLAQVDEALAGLDRCHEELRAERLALRGAVVDEADLRGALVAFEPLWDELVPRERARVLALLVERVTFDGRTNEVSISFRPNGLRGLGDATREGTA